MKIDLELAPLNEIDTDVLVLLEHEGRPDDRIDLKALREAGEITGKTGELTLLHGLNGFRALRVLVAGAGKPEKFDAAEMRSLAGAAARFVKGKGIRRLTFSLGPEPSAAFLAAAVEGALIGNFEPDHHKTDKTQSKMLEAISVSVPEDNEELRHALRRATVVGESQNFCREIANEPPNILTPMALAGHAQKMAEEQGLECEVIDRDRMQQLGMGALLGVAQGSAAPPALIVLHYKPEGSAKSSVHLGLVGKGVTFDTGGISIKPAENMDKMKYDMAGGAAVLGAMRAIAQLKPPIPVTALIPAVENMPGANAQRPGDIVTSLSGKTIEVLNTDAEGRLILADAITYAKRLGCTHLVDAATLTGAIVVALGHVRTGVFSNDEALLDRWTQASKAEGEKMWAMPLDDEFHELLKSPNADIANIGGRWGGACSAAAFLKEFADPTPWLHLDIAGTGWIEEKKPDMAQGPTGTPIRSFVHLAMNWRS